MQTLKIKTHRMSSSYQANHFFILSKGYNAGKPLTRPCPNCFVLQAECQEDMDKLYWICYSVWKSGRFIPLLVGSVIPFLHISDVRKELRIAVEKAMANEDQFSKTVQALQALMKTERLLDLQQRLIENIKQDAIRKLFS